MALGSIEWQNCFDSHQSLLRVRFCFWLEQISFVCTRLRRHNFPCSLCWYICLGYNCSWCRGRWALASLRCQMCPWWCGGGGGGGGLKSDVCATASGAAAVVVEQFRRSSCRRNWRRQRRRLLELVNDWPSDAIVRSLEPPTSRTIYLYLPHTRHETTHITDVWQAEGDDDWMGEGGILNDNCSWCFGSLSNSRQSNIQSHENNPKSMTNSKLRSYQKKNKSWQNLRNFRIPFFSFKSQMFVLFEPRWRHACLC